MEWKQKNDSQCDINYGKSAKEMEAEGILQLFSQSVEELGLRYTSLFGDGHSASYHAVLEAKLHRQGVEVTKKNTCDTSEKNGNCTSKSSSMKESGGQRQKGY